MFNKKKKAIDQANTQNKVNELVKKNNKLITELEKRDLEIEYLKKQLFVTQTSLRGAEIELLCKDKELRKSNLKLVTIEGRYNV